MVAEVVIGDGEGEEDVEEGGGGDRDGREQGRGS
jgi:hypothetical protein